MDRIEKLLRKISVNDRKRLLLLVERILAGDRALKAQKLRNTDFYRVRHGDFRVIFHRDNGEPVIDSIRMRNEKTYKYL